jgi:hypothetical protein
MVRKQADTRGVTTHAIVSSPEFARGLDEVRKGLPFDPNNDNWHYERGRAFGFIAPLNMQLRIADKLNEKALRLAEAAFRSRCRLHGGLSPGAPRGPKNGNFKNGDWTIEAIEERRWLRSMVNSFAKSKDVR